MDKLEKKLAKVGIMKIPSPFSPQEEQSLKENTLKEIRPTLEKLEAWRRKSLDTYFPPFLQYTQSTYK